MANIRDLFGAPPSEAGPEGEENPEGSFDLETFFDEVNTLRGVDTPEPAAEPEPEPVVEEEGGEGEEEHPPIAASTPAPAADPLTELPAAERAALLALHGVMREDPATAARVLSEFSRPPAAPEPPRLPEDIDPGSFEATIWLQNQELRQQVDQLTQSFAQRTQREEQQSAATVATRAVQDFALRYAPKLNAQDIDVIVTNARESGIAGALAASPQYQGNLQGAYAKALETAAWGNEEIRAKLNDAEATPPAPLPGPTPEGDTRKRKLHALSSAASPVASAPTTKKLQSRPDGRLTPESKEQLITEIATRVARGS